jgi:hypothetical protein
MEQSPCFRDRLHKIMYIIMSTIVVVIKELDWIVIIIIIIIMFVYLKLE